MIHREIKMVNGDYSLESDTGHEGDIKDCDWTLAHDGEEIFCRGSMNANDLREMSELLLEAALELDARLIIGDK